MRNNNNRIVLSLILAFTFSAFLQDRLPPFSMYAIKVPFVLAPFIYYVFRHKLVIGIIAAICCSIMGDGLSISSGVAYLIVSIGTLFLNHYVFKKQLPDNSISCGLIAIPLTVLVLLIQYASIVIFTENAFHISFVLVKLIITAILTGVATIVLSEAFYRFELIVGNKEVADEELG